MAIAPHIASDANTPYINPWTTGGADRACDAVTDGGGDSVVILTLLSMRCVM